MFNRKLTDRRYLVIMFIFFLMLAGVIEYFFFSSEVEKVAIDFITAYKDNDRDLAMEYVHSDSEMILDFMFNMSDIGNDFEEGIDEILETGDGEELSPLWTNNSSAPLRDHLSADCSSVNTNRQKCAICCDTEDNLYIVYLQNENDEWKVVFNKEDF